jgi:hypothetical protein
MKTSELFELRTNAPRQKTENVKRYVDASDPKGRAATDWVPGQGHIPNGKHYKWAKEKVFDKDGKPVMYKPYSDAHYRPGGDHGPAAVMGTVGEWLSKMGATREHLAPALEKVRSSPEYHHAMALGFEDKTSVGDAKNGTLNLVGSYDNGLMGEKPVMVRRKILANGNIRTQADDHDRHGGRGTAAHPVTIDTHPHMDPVDRIVHSMRASIERVTKIYQTQSKHHFVRALQKHKDKTK